MDDYSSAIFVYFHKLKSDTTKALRKFLADSAPYGKVKKIRPDNGGEYLAQQFEAVTIENQIKLDIHRHIHLTKMVQRRETGARFLIWAGLYL